MLSNQWIVPNFYPIGYIPNGVRLTGYGGESSDLPEEVLQDYLNKISVGKIKLAAPNVYKFTQEDVRQAHADMENNRVAGKLVVKID